MSHKSLLGLVTVGAMGASMKLAHGRVRKRVFVGHDWVEVLGNDGVAAVTGQLFPGDLGRS